MKFSSIVVLAVVAPVATGFAPIQRQITAPRTVLRKAAGEYDLDLGIEEAPKKKAAKKAAPAPIPAPVPEPTPAPKSKKRSAKKVVEPTPAPEPAPAPKTKTKAKKVKPEPVKTSPPPPLPVKKEALVATKSASASTKAGGVALGAAPLLLAPLALLTAGRSVLTGTVARREKIQKDIDDAEKAKTKKQVQAEVNGGELFKAAVRIVSYRNVTHICYCECPSRIVKTFYAAIYLP